jgi:gas vesicle protein
MQLLAQCVFWLAVVLLGSMVAGLVAAVLVLLSANDRAEELQQDIAEQLAALKADAERRRQRESARADLRRVK